MTESVWKEVAPWWCSGDDTSSRREGAGFDGRGLLRDAINSGWGLPGALLAVAGPGRVSPVPRYSMHTGRGRGGCGEVSWLGVRHRGRGCAAGVAKAGVSGQVGDAKVWALARAGAAQPAGVGDRGRNLRGNR